MALTKKKRSLLSRTTGRGRGIDIEFLDSNYFYPEKIKKYGINWGGMGVQKAAFGSTFGKNILKTSNLVKQLNKAKITGTDINEFNEWNFKRQAANRKRRKKK